MIRKLAERIKQTNKQLELLSFKDANRKVVYSIVNAADRGQQVDNGVLIKLSIGDIASMTAVDIAKVKEILQKLTGSKLLLPHEQGFVVTDKKKLFKFLEFLAMKEQFGDFS
jgi:CRP-like cAMP-binding protein